jgi:hypothetical protein
MIRATGSGKSERDSIAARRTIGSSLAGILSSRQVNFWFGDGQSYVNGRQRLFNSMAWTR